MQIKVAQALGFASPVGRGQTGERVCMPAGVVIAHTGGVTGDHFCIAIRNVTGFSDREKTRDFRASGQRSIRKYSEST